jgi:hypothetical protein
MKIVMRSKFNSFPIFATNGLLSNVHTGKFRLIVSRDANGQCTIKSYNPGGYNSIVKGMQIYSPFTRKASRKRVVKGHSSMMRFPTIVRQMLYPDTFFHEEDDYSSTIDDFTRKMEWLDDHKDSYLRDLCTFVNIGCRMEFFMEYTEKTDRDDAEEADDDDDYLQEEVDVGDRWIHENFHRVSNLATSMRLIKTLDLKHYLETKLVHNMRPFTRLREMIRTHRTGGTLPNLSSLRDSSKAAMVVHAELLVANLDFHPFVPKTLLKMMTDAIMTQYQKIGSWRIPERFHRPLSDQEKQITGLKYGIHPRFLKKRIKVSRLGQANPTRERDSNLLERASKYKKTTRLPVFFLQAVDKLKAILQFYSLSLEEEDPFSINPLWDDDIPETEDEFVYLDPTQVVDFSYISNVLPSKKRVEMEHHIGVVSALLYNQNYCDLLTNPRYNTSGNRKLPGTKFTGENFPKSKFEFISTVSENAMLDNDLNWTLAPTLCNTPCKCRK